MQPETAPPANPEDTLRQLIFSLPDMPDHYSLSSEKHHTYAIVNGAGDENVYVNLHIYEPECRNLYPEGIEQKIDGPVEVMAPWLIKLTEGEPYTEWLLTECLNKKLLFFIQSTHNIDTLTNHLRNYTHVEMPNKEGGWKFSFLSFYDPTLFLLWISTLTLEEAQTFQQPMSNVWIEQYHDFTEEEGRRQLNLIYLKTDHWYQHPFHLDEVQTIPSDLPNNTPNNPQSKIPSETKSQAPSQHIYQMQPHTLQVFEENKRHRFCKISLRDLKESGFPADPKDPKQLETLIDLSKKLDTIGYHLQAFQYRYFILFTKLGSSFLQDKNIEEHLMQLGTDTDRQKFLDHLIISNLQGEG